MSEEQDTNTEKATLSSIAGHGESSGCNENNPVNVPADHLENDVLAAVQHVENELEVETEQEIVTQAADQQQEHDNGQLDEDLESVSMEVDQPATYEMHNHPAVVFPIAAEFLQPVATVVSAQNFFYLGDEDIEHAVENGDVLLDVGVYPAQVNPMGIDNRMFNFNGNEIFFIYRRTRTNCICVFQIGHTDEGFLVYRYVHAVFRNPNI
ncbi:uncharacterized protein LOC125767300 isoform X1 [Anopheles funestus]